MTNNAICYAEIDAILNMMDDIYPNRSIISEFVELEGIEEILKEMTKADRVNQTFKNFESAKKFNSHGRKAGVELSDVKKVIKSIKNKTVKKFKNYHDMND